MRTDLNVNYIIGPDRKGGGGLQLDSDVQRASPNIDADCAMEKSIQITTQICTGRMGFDFQMCAWGDEEEQAGMKNISETSCSS